MAGKVKAVNMAASTSFFTVLSPVVEEPGLLLALVGQKYCSSLSPDTLKYLAS
jgi:hypothetical protein